MAGLFQVLWGAEDGFKPVEPLKGTDGKLLIIPADEGNKELVKKICTRPTAVDWDGDKTLDLVVGNFEGSFYVFSGEGDGKFDPTPEVIKCEGEDLRIDGVHSDPFVIDWDGDGDLDLLSGSSNGGARWAENKAGEGKSPELRPFSALVEAPGYNKSTGDTPSDSTRVWVDDFNGDDKLDLILGDRLSIKKDGKSERTGRVWVYLQK